MVKISVKAKIYNVFIFFVYSLLYLTLFTGCTPLETKVPQILIPEDFLSTFQRTRLEPADILEKSTGAAFIMGHYIEKNPDNGRFPDGPLPFYLVSIIQEPLPYSKEAALRATEILLDKADNSKIKELTEALQTTFASDIWAERIIAQCAYEINDNDLLLTSLERLKELNEDFESDSEVFLWNIIGKIRQNNRPPIKDILFFISNFEASKAHLEFNSYLQNQPVTSNQIDDSLLRLIQSKAAIADKKFIGDPDSLWEDILRMFPDGITESILWDLYHAALQTNQLSSTALNLQEFSQNASQTDTSTANHPKSNYNNTVVLTAMEISGRCYAGLYRYTLAEQLLYQGMELILGSVDLDVESQQAQRIVWHWWRASLNQGLIIGLNKIPLLASWIRNPDIFSDQINDLISLLIRQQEWNQIEQLYASLGEEMTVSLKARTAWILAETRRLELSSPLNSQSPDRNSLLETAARQNESLYYQSLAKITLGEPISFPLVSKLYPSKLKDEDYNAEESRALVEQLYAAGLLADGFNQLYPAIEYFSLEEITTYASLHQQAGEYKNQMRLTERASYRLPLEGELRAFSRLRYPHAFSEEINPVIENYGLSSSIFYGLIREESYFDPSAGSWAGAQGLCQLMPATANDMAILLRWKNPDLTDPQTNVTIGGYYFGRLYNRFGNMVQALAAYNAGQGRVNQWRYQAWAASPVLFHEGIPYEETRHYIRKIFVSAVNYQYFYQGESPNSIYEAFFPID